MSVKELSSKILSASEMTRVAATLLWALLALVKHRSEELLRMDIVLTCFMQAWQAQPSADASNMFGAVPVSVFGVDMGRPIPSQCAAQTDS